MTYTNEELDKLLTEIRKNNEKNIYDEDNNDDLHDDDKAPPEYYEGVWETLNEIRSKLNIPETDKTEYKHDEDDNEDTEDEEQS